MPFKAYEEFAAGPLRLPIGGKTYEIPEVSYEAGLMLQKLSAGEAPDLKADDQWRLLMGTAYDEMRADNVPAKALARAIMACLADYRIGREVAEQTWEVGLDPEAIAPTGATSGTGSSSTDGETETPNPASTSGTSSPKASRKRAKGPRATPSRRSASTGA